MQIALSKLNDLEQHRQQFKDHFQTQNNCLTRTFFLLHTINYLIHVKNKLKRIQESQSLNTNDLRQIREIDSAVYIGKTITMNFIGKIEEKEEKEGSPDLKGQDVMNIVLTTFKMEIITITLFYLLDIIFRISFSVFAFDLFLAVKTKNTSSSYILVAVLIIFWYLSQLFRHQGQILSYIFGSKLKAGLSMLLFQKISQMSAFSLQTSDLGKITNLLATDLGVMEQRLANVLILPAFPILLTGLTVLIYIRVGWIGLVSILTVVVLVLVSNMVSAKQSALVKEGYGFKDKRVEKTTELIEGIKPIKLYGWQIPFSKMIAAHRQKEVKGLKKMNFIRAFERTIGLSATIICSFVIVTFAIQVNSNLTFAHIFSAIEIIFALKYYIFCSVQGLGLVYQIMVVFERFAQILNIQAQVMTSICGLSQDKNHSSQDSHQQAQIFNKKESSLMIEEKSDDKFLQKNSTKVEEQIKTIIFNKFNVYWKNDIDNPSIKNITHIFKKGCLVGISGKVGSGKSSLLKSIIKQIPFYSGDVQIQGSITIFEQEPFIFSDTVRNNIIFGKQYNKDEYNEAVRMSCLHTDFKLFANGDQTIIGEKGATLSGGQKARVSLARCIYSKADIFLLDDPLSAVDSKVAKEIFRKCIKPLSCEKTIILSTHQIGFLHECDEVILLEGGQIISKGTPGELNKQIRRLAQSAKEEPEQSRDKQNVDEKSILQSQHSDEEAKGDALLDIPLKRREEDEESERAQKQTAINSLLSNRFNQKQSAVNWTTYKRFFLSSKFNYIIIPLALFFFVLCQVLVAIEFGFFAQYNSVQSGTSRLFGNNIGLFQWAMTINLVAIVITYFLKYFLLNCAILLASESIHNDMVDAVLHSPASFFDTTPSGVLINKFSNDLGLIDYFFFFPLNFSVAGPITVAIALIYISVISFYFLIPSVLAVVGSLLFFNYSRPAIIKCKELDLQTKNVLFSFFGETVGGITQIRVFGRIKQRLESFSAIINKTTKTNFAYNLVTKGFVFNITAFTIFLMLSCMLIGVTSVNPNLYAVIVIYLINVNQIYFVIMREIIFAQSSMVSAERILTLQHLSREKDFRTSYDLDIGLERQIQAAQNDDNFHEEWPQTPFIEIKNLSARYRQNLPLILNEVSFRVKAGEKVGIVGRTGAGKSSFIQALFRIIEPESGSVYEIDGNNVLEMGLHSLRQHLSVIPQTPFIFKGTIKLNLDPFETAKEEELWEVLAQSGLSDHIRTVSISLYSFKTSWTHKFHKKVKVFQ